VNIDCFVVDESPNKLLAMENAVGLIESLRQNIGNKTDLTMLGTFGCNCLFFHPARNL